MVASSKVAAGRLLLAAWFVLLALPMRAAEPRVYRDLGYGEPKNERQTLDLYAPAEGSDHPVIVWIHGGGWRQGDKAMVQHKPQAFVDKGFVFVSVNYRFVPQATVKEITGDIAKAVKWVSQHAAEYGGSPDALFVAGHSAGAHLAALVCTDERYLKAEGLPLSSIKGCIPVDTAAYDVPERAKGAGPVRAASGANVFGPDEAIQKELSPIAHIAKGKGIPPFLILHVASRPDSRAQSQAFAKTLQESGVDVNVVPAAGKTHGTINRDLGLPEDVPTKAVFQFLDRVRQK